MKTIVSLVRREFYEHRGMFVWMPIFVSSLITVLAIIGVVTGVGESNDGGRAYQLLSIEDKVRLILNTAYMVSFAPMLIVQAAAIFFYSIGTLYDERKDRSILFWKSLPLSDGMTIFSKLISALLCLPLIVFFVSLFSAGLIITAMCFSLATRGYNLFGAVLNSPSLYLLPVEIISLLPVYIFWALPTVGWLFMASSWARSKVLLWAVGVPILSIAAVRVINLVYELHWGIDWISNNILLRSLDGVLPGVWIFFGKYTQEIFYNQHQALDLGQVFILGWQSFTSTSPWIGAVLGVAMLYMATVMRRFHSEA